MNAPIENDPDVRQNMLSLDEKLTKDQVEYVGRMLRKLITQLEKKRYSEPLRPVEWEQWNNFILSTYACGFVCCDGGETMDDRAQTPISQVIRALQEDPKPVEGFSLRELRQIIHFIIRSERWGDAGAETGGGAVWGLIDTSLGDAIARRLGA
ncbi:hypothetical protein DFP92_1187 [Yoonia sediminilitoris]|uniref:Uncharacterized protein n=2 Tax=Yoonia sediminilitoris TaxID=1286148 RepID=A0A2T6K760_9RHOB|nr:hypothetical protein C8N45_11836 [Yoonia sediminilitoris]RCW90062.1 hypothetical protein DFP92_1187 [Yoonia sediminilitoris]